MNTKLITSAVFAVAALSGASAFAQSNLYGEAAQAIQPVASTSTVTRAQVQGNSLSAGQNGEAAASQQAALAQRQEATGTVSRADVRSQAQMAARANLGGRSAI